MAASPKPKLEMYLSPHPSSKLAGRSIEDFVTPNNEGVMSGVPPTWNAWMKHGFLMSSLGPSHNTTITNAASAIGINQFLTMTGVTLAYGDHGLTQAFTAVNPSIMTIQSTPKIPAAYVATYGRKITVNQRWIGCFTTSFPNFAMGVGTLNATGLHAANPADWIGIRSDLTGTDKLVGTVQGGGAGAVNADIGVLGTTFGVGVIHDIGIRWTLGATAAECSGEFYYRNYSRVLSATPVEVTVTPFTAAQLGELVQVNDQLSAYLEHGRTDSAVTTAIIRNYFAMSDIE